VCGPGFPSRAAPASYGANHTGVIRPAPCPGIGRNVRLARFVARCHGPSRRASLRRVTCHVVDAPALTLTPSPLEPAQVVAGAPAVSTCALLEADQVEIGVWEHGEGTSTDVEADEVFVVLSGRATVEVGDGSTLELAPGSVGFLDAGTRTTWTVHETLRKVYVLH
jgi:uncharacterized protein